MEMREKIARAIRTELRSQGVIWEDEPFDPSQLMMQTGAVADMGKLVLAVLNAMRIPTVRMHNAAAFSEGQATPPVLTIDDETGLIRCQWRPADPTRIWQAMIDSALTADSTPRNPPPPSSPPPSI